MITHSQINGWYDWQPLIKRIVENQLPSKPVYIEVGVWHGKSMVDFVHLCRAVNKTPFCIGVDTFGGKQDDQWMDKMVESKGGRFFEITENNLIQAGVEEYVHLVEGKSLDAVRTFDNESADVILIDALHTYAAVKADTEAYWPKLKPGGWMLWHDADRPEVRRAITEAVGPKFNVESPRTAFKQKL